MMRWSETSEGCITNVASPPTPPQIILNAGESVTIVFTNMGKLEHEFMAGTGATGKGYGHDWLAQANPSPSGGHVVGRAGPGSAAPTSSAPAATPRPSASHDMEGDGEAH